MFIFHNSRFKIRQKEKYLPPDLEILLLPESMSTTPGANHGELFEKKRR